MTVHHLVAEHAADVRLHDAAEAVVAAAELEADVVDRVLERLEMVARVADTLDERRKLDPAHVLVAGRRDRAHLVARAMAELANHDGVQGEVREVLLTDVDAAPCRGLEVGLRDREVRDHDLGSTPVAPDEAAENDGAIVDGFVLHEKRIVQRRQEVRLAPHQEPDVAQPPGALRKARRQPRVEERLGGVAEREVLWLVLEAQDESDHIVAEREDGAGVDGVPLHEPHHVRQRNADIGVEKVAHGHRPVWADLDARLGDDAELPVAQEHALEIVVAFLHTDDVARGSHDLQFHGLVGRAAVARRIDVDAADAEGPAHGRQHVERRARVIEPEGAQRLGDVVPRHARLDPRGPAVAFEQPAQAFQIEEDSVGGDRLTPGGQAAATARDGNAVALRGPEHFGDILGSADMNDRVGEAVDNLAAVGPVAGACGAIGTDQHSSLAESGNRVIG